MTGSRMHNHALRLVHDDHVVILIQNIQRDILRLNLQIVRRRQKHINHLSFLQLQPGFSGRNRHRICTGRQNMPLLNQLPDVGPGLSIHFLRQKDIQPAASFCHICSIDQHLSRRHADLLRILCVFQARLSLIRL